MGSHLLKQCVTKRHDPCIWMQAGVVRRKFCQREYECTPCSFDRSLRRTAEENRRLRQRGLACEGRRCAIGFWKDRMMELPPVRRPCLHHMKKRIGFKACTNEYQCSRCEFDQYFSDHFAVHAVVQPVDVLDVDGFKIPQGYYLHQGHAWAKIEAGAEVRIGMDDFALRLMGPFDRIEAPLIGKTVEQGRANIRLSRGPRHAQLLSPVSGVVTAVNPR